MKYKIFFIKTLLLLITTNILSCRILEKRNRSKKDLSALEPVSGPLKNPTPCLQIVKTNKGQIFYVSTFCQGNQYIHIPGLGDPRDIERDISISLSGGSFRKYIDSVEAEPKRTSSDYKSDIPRVDFTEIDKARKSFETQDKAPLKETKRRSSETVLSTIKTVDTDVSRRTSVSSLSPNSLLKEVFDAKLFDARLERVKAAASKFRSKHKPDFSIFGTQYDKVSIDGESFPRLKKNIEYSLETIKRAFGFDNGSYQLRMKGYKEALETNKFALSSLNLRIADAKEPQKSRLVMARQETEVEIKKLEHDLGNFGLAAGFIVMHRVNQVGKIQRLIDMDNDELVRRMPDGTDDLSANNFRQTLKNIIEKDNIEVDEKLVKKISLVLSSPPPVKQASSARNVDYSRLLLQAQGYPTKPLSLKPKSDDLGNIPDPFFSTKTYGGLKALEGLTPEEENQLKQAMRQKFMKYENVARSVIQADGLPTSYKKRYTEKKLTSDGKLVEFAAVKSYGPPEGDLQWVPNDEIGNGPGKKYPTNDYRPYEIHTDPRSMTGHSPRLLDMFKREYRDKYPTELDPSVEGNNIESIIDSVTNLRSGFPPKTIGDMNENVQIADAYVKAYAKFLFDRNNPGVKSTDEDIIAQLNSAKSFTADIDLSAVGESGRVGVGYIKSSDLGTVTRATENAAAIAEQVSSSVGAQKLIHHGAESHNWAFPQNALEDFPVFLVKDDGTCMLIGKGPEESPFRILFEEYSKIAEDSGVQLTLNPRYMIEHTEYFDDLELPSHQLKMIRDYVEKAKQEPSLRSMNPEELDEALKKLENTRKKPSTPDIPKNNGYISPIKIDLNHIIELRNHRVYEGFQLNNLLRSPKLFKFESPLGLDSVA